MVLSGLLATVQLQHGGLSRGAKVLMFALVDKLVAADFGVQGQLARGCGANGIGDAVKMAARIRKRCFHFRVQRIVVKQAEQHADGRFQPGI